MMFDTDVLIWASRGNEQAAQMINGFNDRAVSVISFMELLQGARSRAEALAIKQSLRQMQFKVLPISDAIGAVAVTLIEQYSLGQGIQVADALIAATAMDAGHPLCTANVKHFRPLRGLSLVAFRVRH